MTWRFWVCLVLSVALAAAALLVFGVSLWTVLFALTMLACPAVMVWSYFTGVRPLPVPLGPVPETRGMTLNWMAPFYDRLAQRLGVGPPFRARTLAFARLRSGERVLDVGCGTGVLTRLAAKAVAPHGHAVGIDPAPDMIRVALANSAEVRPIVDFKVAAIEDLPFPDANFDAAFASFMIHHLPPDLKQTGLREVHRVLKPGGRFVVVDLDRPADRLWWLLLWPMLFVASTAPHLRGQVPSYLRRAGFVSVETQARWRGLATFWTGEKPA